MATRARSSRDQQAVNTAPLWTVGAIALGVAAMVVHLPGGVLMWAGLLVASFQSVMPELTGKDEMKMPIPANPGEERLLRRYRARSATRMVLFGCAPSVVSVWRPVWWAAAAAGAAAGLMPRIVEVPWWGGLVSGVGVWLSVLMLADLVSRAQGEDLDPSPRVSFIDVFVQVRRVLVFRRVLIVAAPVAAGVSVGVVAARFAGVFPVLPRIPYPEVAVHVSALAVPVMPWFALACAFAAACGVLPLLVAPGVLAEWRERTAARALWRSRFELKMKKQPVPDLLDHRVVVPGVVVDVFAVPPSAQRETYLLCPKVLGSVVGDGNELFALPLLVDDGQGGKLESNDRFRLVVVERSAAVDLSSSDTPDEVAGLLFECMCSRVLEGESPAVVETVRISAGESPAPVWRWGMHLSRVSSQMVRDQVASLSGMLGVQVLVDGGTAWGGALLEPSTVFDEQAAGAPSERVRSALQDVADFDWWEKVWAGVMGSPTETPTYQPATQAEAALPDGAVVRYAAFVIRQDLDPAKFFGREAKLATAIQNPAFASIMPFLDPVASTPDHPVRHKQAIAVAWSPSVRPDGQPNRIPRAPQAVEPTVKRGRRSAQEMVLSGMVSSAFTVAKLDQPLLVGVEALTSPVDMIGAQEASRAKRRGATREHHIWRVRLLLYGNTFAEVLRKAPNIQQAIGSPWLRMEQVPYGVDLFVGAVPDASRMSAKALERTVALDWASSWVTAKVVGSDGATPRLMSAEPLAGNPEVMRVVFELPASLPLERVRSARAQLRAARGVAFLEVEGGEDARQMVATFSKEDPVPTVAPMDVEVSKSAEGYAFGVGYDGAPRAFRPRRDVHMLMVGMSGSGKSVTLQQVVSSAIRKGTWVVVVDPSKGGVDFAFADGFLVAPRAATLEEAVATLEAVYEEVKDRKALHAEYGVGSFTDLPDGVRRPQILVVVDEFTSLVNREPVPPKSTDGQAMKARARIELGNARRAKVGDLVGRLMREARSVGLSVILGTQKLDQKTLAQVPGGNDLKDNASRAILGATTMGALQSALRNPMRAPDLGDVVPPGRGVFESATGMPELFQTWWATQEELSASLAGVSAPQRRFDVEAFMPEDPVEAETTIDESGLVLLTQRPDDEVEELELDLSDVSLDELLVDEPAMGSERGAESGAGDDWGLDEGLVSTPGVGRKDDSESGFAGESGRGEQTDVDADRKDGSVPGVPVGAASAGGYVFGVSEVEPVSGPVPGEDRVVADAWDGPSVASDDGSGRERILGEGQVPVGAVDGRGTVGDSVPGVSRGLMLDGGAGAGGVGGGPVPGEDTGFGSSTSAMPGKGSVIGGAADAPAPPSGFSFDPAPGTGTSGSSTTRGEGHVSRGSADPVPAKAAGSRAPKVPESMRDLFGPDGSIRF